MAKLTDEEILAICSVAVGESDAVGGDIASERADALEYYLGSVEQDENLPEGRSKVRSGDVLETIQLMMPSLMRIFMDAENLVSFDAMGADDVEAAEQESDRVSRVFWKENDGFLNCYQFCADALLSKNGIFKVWWDDEGNVEREEYDNLTGLELAELLTDSSVVREAISHEVDTVPGQMGLEERHRVVFETRELGKIHINVVPPEEFGVGRDTASPNVKDATFCWHRTRRTRSDLIEEGYSRSLVESLSGEDSGAAQTQQHLARYNKSEEQALAGDIHRSIEQIWVTEAYIKLDRNDDGIAELLRVTFAGRGDSGGVLLDIEEADRIPFCSASPIVLTHKWHGMSLADLVMGLEDIRTALLRAMVDNANLANHQRTGVSESVNYDDLMTYRPGGLVRVEDGALPRDHILPLPNAELPQSTFGLLEVIDQMRQRRTGAGEEVAMLDPSTLANANTGVVQLAYDAARAKIELIARIFGELAFKPLFLDIRELLQKHTDRAETVELRGKWVEMNPADWRKRQSMTVEVGAGRANKQRRLLAVDRVISRQFELAQAGAAGELMLGEHMFNALTDEAELLGLPSGERYYQDPRQVPPPQPQPDPQQTALEAQVALGREQNQISMQRVQVEAAKVQSTERLRLAELQARQVEVQTKRQVEGIKAGLAQLEQSQDAAIDQQKVEFESRLSVAEMAQQAAAAEAKLRQDQYRTEVQAMQAAQQREVELYKANLDASLEEAKMMQGMAAQVPGLVEKTDDEPDPMSDIREALAELRERAAEQADFLERRREPVTLVKNAEGITEFIKDGFGTREIRREGGTVDLG